MVSHGFKVARTGFLGFPVIQPRYTRAVGDREVVEKRSSGRGVPDSPELDFPAWMFVARLVSG